MKLSHPTTMLRRALNRTEFSLPHAGVPRQKPGVHVIEQPSTGLRRAEPIPLMASLNR
jgi:hypothetical protein